MFHLRECKLSTAQWLCSWRGGDHPKLDLLESRFSTLESTAKSSGALSIFSDAVDMMQSCQVRKQSQQAELGSCLLGAGGRSGNGRRGWGLSNPGAWYLTIAWAEHPCPTAHEDGAASLPFIFRPQQLEHPCPAYAGADTCNSPMPYQWAALCSFQAGLEYTYTDFMLCSPEQRDAVVSYYMAEKHDIFDSFLNFSP